MDRPWLLFLLLTLMCLFIHGFYSMSEMAAVSFNRVRLQFYVSKKKKRAIWLNKLLDNPAALFGTTLIGVNTAMQFGSECSRRFYSSLGLSPDWAPLSQIIIVLIFAELSPLFAARRYSEHVSMLTIPIVYFSSIVMKPAIYLLDLICRFVNFLLGVKSQRGLQITRDELQKAIEERGDPILGEYHGELDTILRNIFSLKIKVARDIMEPLETLKLLPSDSTVAGVRQLLGLEYLPFLPIYHQQKENITGVVYLRNLLRLSEQVQIRDYARPPWFITDKTPLLQVLSDFKKNKESLSIVLNDEGNAVGALSLDAVVDEIFGERDDWISFGEFLPEKRKVFVDVTASGDALVTEINKQYSLKLPIEDETLEELMHTRLGHHPDQGESIRFGSIELSLEESSIMGGQIIRIRSI